MNPDYELYEQIDRYLNRSMSDQELAEFNKRLASDETLRETVEAQKLANELILDEELVQLKERMRKDMSDAGSTGPSNSTKYVIASFFAITSAALLYFFIQNNNAEETKHSDNTISTSGIIENNTATTGVSPSVSSVPDDPEGSVIASGKTKNPLPSVSEEEKNTLQNPEAKTYSPNKEIALSDQTGTREEEKKNTKSLSHTTESVKVLVDCSEIHITANAGVYYENNNTEAVISVDTKTIRGGTTPYLFALENYQFSGDNTFEGIQEGLHRVFIKDDNGCISEVQKLNVKFQEKTIDESFNPSQGEKWTFPLDGNQDGTITIQNKTGQIVYTKPIQGGYPSEWDGLDNNGNELGAGNYVFIINFANKKLVKGHITIYR